MHEISAVIITLNEEKNIGRCIDSIRDVADEIIVADSFSADKTKEICETKGVQFFQREWEGYSKTKNWANEQARFEYILSIDADEELSNELKNSILQEKEKGLGGIYEFNRMTNYCGKWIRHCGWYPDKKTRLFPKEGAVWEGGFVHEDINFVRHPDKKWLKGDLLHYSYYTTQDHIERIEKYSELAAQAILSQGKNPSIFKLVFSSFFKFFKTYFIALGFLDGIAGCNIAWYSGKAVYLKYKKARANG